MNCVICGNPAHSPDEAICAECNKDFDKVAVARREVMHRNQCPTCGAPLVGTGRGEVQRAIRDRLFVPGSPAVNENGTIDYNEKDAVSMLREARAKTQEGKRK